MKISVVIPTYNCARYLPLALDSALAQTRPADEIIVVDDGSSDDSQTLVEQRYGSRVRYIRQVNAGPAAARNNGIRAASGDVIGFLDADDIWFPETLAHVADCIDSLPQVALVSADKQAIDSDGVVTAPSWWDRNGVREALYADGGRPIEAPLARLVRTNFINTSLAFVRRTALDDVGLFDETIRYGEDYELWLRIAARHAVVCLPEVLGQYRLHQNNTTRATEPMLKDFVVVSRKLREWGRSALKAAGIDADRTVSDALCDLGYWYFCAGRMPEARDRLGESLREQLNLRAFKYMLASLLPATALARLRKQQD